MNIKWTEAEKEFVRTNAALATDEQLAMQLSRSRKVPVAPNKIQQLRNRLGIKRVKAPKVKLLKH